MFIFFKQKTTYEMLACLKFSCVPSRSDIAPRLRITEDYRPATDLSPAEAANDCRDAIRPKHPQPDSTFTPRPYYQVYRQKWGFQPNLSILDLLFNEGNEAVLYL